MLAGCALALSLWHAHPWQIGLAMAVYGAITPNARVTMRRSPNATDPPMVGIGSTGVVPLTVGDS